MLAFCRKHWYGITLWTASLLYLFLVYYPVIKYNYVVPPGDDPYGHINVLYGYVENNFRYSGGYPFGFHFIVFLVSKLTGASLVSSMVVVYPLLLFFSSWAVWFFTHRQFGKYPALVAFFLYSFVAYQPLQTIQDGGFPNVLAAGVFLPIFLSYYVDIFNAKTARQRGFAIGYSLIYAALVILTHHLSTLYLFSLVGVSFPILIFQATQSASIGKRVLYAGGTVVFFCLIALAIYTSGILDSAITLARGFIRIQSGYPFIVFIGSLDQATAIQRNLKDYMDVLGITVGLVGGVGIAWLLIKQLFYDAKYAETLTVIWVGVLFIASRITYIGFPVRASRDMTTGLVVAASLVLVALWRRAGMSSVVAKLLIIAASALLLYPIRLDVAHKLPLMVENSRMVRFTYQDRWIADILPDNSRVVISGLNFFYGFFRPDSSFRPIWWENLRFEDIDLNNYDYIVMEEYKSQSWLLNKIDRKVFEASPRLRMIKSYRQPFKTVYLYRILPGTE